MPFLCTLLESVAIVWCGGRERGREGKINSTEEWKKSKNTHAAAEKIVKAGGVELTPGKNLKGESKGEHMSTSTVGRIAKSRKNHLFYSIFLCLRLTANAVVIIVICFVHCVCIQIHLNVRFNESDVLLLCGLSSYFFIFSRRELFSVLQGNDDAVDFP